MPLIQGQVLNNRYRIVKLFRSGGFGSVYRAWDMNFNIPCAVKENLDLTPEVQRQFAREALILRTLHHSNLPQVVDYFLVQGQGQYLVMDFVDGKDLQELIDDAGGALSEAQVIPWINQVCDALECLHSQNPPIIHRDIKPGNIKITPQGKAVLVDFGIAKYFDPNSPTTTGARAVTLGFSPPEQYGAGTTDVRSDVYALGATLYAALTGQRPTESVLRSVGAPLPAPRSMNQAISAHIETATLKAMEMTQPGRYPSVAQFKAALSIPGQAYVPTPPQAAAAPPATASAAPRLPVTPPPAYSAPTMQSSPQAAPGQLSQPAPPWPVSQAGRGLSGKKNRAVIQIASAVLLVGITLGSFFILKYYLDRAHTTPTPTTEVKATNKTIVRDQDKMVMVYVPAGEFLRGSADSDPDARSDEKPQRTIPLDAFWIDKTEVTNAMYALCVEAGACQPPSSSESDTRSAYYGNSTYAHYPVIYVSWEDAKTYCDWAGARLPSEAEWEKAARGPDGRLYPWGDQSPDANLSNYNQNVGDTTEAGSYPNGASFYGALDMAGNVWEWVADWYAENYYTSSPAANPPGPTSGQYRVLRGGGWNYYDSYLRVAYRDIRRLPRQS